MSRWGMVIDVKKCIGCWACTVACKEEHFLQRGMFWNRVLIGEEGDYPSVTKLIYPVLCNHCEEAACVEVCPTGATFQRDDGIVLVDYDKCIGCRYCLIACPYQQRTPYKDDQVEYFPGQGFTEFELIGKKIYPFQKGTMTKCNFCVERIDKGREKGLEPGRDEEATPACVNICPVGARKFGDLDDPESDVMELKRVRKGKPLHAEFGTDPCVFYVD
jgi:Fe-S-cluster-containing dehydrogenase component